MTSVSISGSLAELRSADAWTRTSRLVVGLCFVAYIFDVYELTTGAALGSQVDQHHIVLVTVPLYATYGLLSDSTALFTFGLLLCSLFLAPFGQGKWGWVEETFPTEVRATGLAMASFIAGVAQAFHSLIPGVDKPLIQTVGERAGDGQQLLEAPFKKPRPDFSFMSQLALRGISKAYGRRVIFEDVSLAVRPGEHVGVVGDNGAGKSTLLRMIAGLERPDAGHVVVQASGGIGHLDQTIDLSPTATVQQAIDAALADLRWLERELRSTEAALAAGSGGSRTLQRYDDLLSAFEARGGYAVEQSLDAALTGLGLANVGRDRLLGSLSGGELRRLALGCLLASAPEVLLLDEPTNHLDDACLDWLEERLRAHRGTVVAVSHDRLFLERIATAILEVDADQQTIVRYGDGYAGYLREKAAARQRWQDAYERWLGEVQAVADRAETTAQDVGYGRRSDNDKVGYNLHGVRVERQIGSRVRNAGERLRRLHDAAVAKPPDPLRFTARFEGGDASGVLLAVDDVRVEGRLNVSQIVVGAGDRLLIRGPNGAGKTTLLRVCVGEVRPDRGRVRRRGRIGYLPQEVPAMHSQQRLLHAFGEGLGGDPEEHLPRLLSLGLFREDDVWVPVARLSVGQRQRLALARLLVHDYDLLLLDEPTNHLAPDLVEALEAALAEFAGALVIVSHDRLLRRRLRMRERSMQAGELVA